MSVSCETLSGKTLVDLFFLSASSLSFKGAGLTLMMDEGNQHAFLPLQISRLIPHSIVHDSDIPLFVALRNICYVICSIFFVSQ